MIWVGFRRQRGEKRRDKHKNLRLTGGIEKKKSVKGSDRAENAERLMCIVSPLTLI